MSDRPAPPPGVRTLWLLRHAKAVADPPRGGSDFDRVLAPRGRKAAAALGRLLADRPREEGGSNPLAGVPFPQVALVSPAARTSATAELALAELGDPPEIRLVEELYGAGPDDVLILLRALPRPTRSAMVVGHNPTMHALAQGLLAAADEAGRSLTARQGFPTCALGVYRLETGGWLDLQAETATLVALLRPPY